MIKTFHRKNTMARFMTSTNKMRPIHPGEILPEKFLVPLGMIPIPIIAFVQLRAETSSAPTRTMRTFYSNLRLIRSYFMFLRSRLLTQKMLLYQFQKNQTWNSGPSSRQDAAPTKQKRRISCWNWNKKTLTGSGSSPNPRPFPGWHPCLVFHRCQILLQKP